MGASVKATDRKVSGSSPISARLPQHEQWVDCQSHKLKFVRLAYTQEKIKRSGVQVPAVPSYPVGSLIKATILSAPGVLSHGSDTTL